MKPPAEIAHAPRQIAADQEEAGRGVAHRRQPARHQAGEPRHQQPAEPPVARAAAGDVAAADTKSADVLLHDGQHARQQRGGWLRSASITPTIGALRGGEAFDDGRAEAELAGAVQHRDPVARRELVGERAGAVRRVVVDDDELAVEPSAA